MTMSAEQTSEELARCHDAELAAGNWDLAHDLDLEGDEKFAQCSGETSSGTSNDKPGTAP